jgi:hypothetical protein
VLLQVLVVAIVLVLGGAGWAEAQCPAGFNDAGAECQLNADITATGTVVFTKTVHLLAGSSITALDATGFTLQVNSGDFIMESGSELDGDQAGACPRTGAPITVDLTTGQGNINLKPGSSVHSNSCAGGFIQLLTGGPGIAEIDGVVESVGTQSGTGQGRPGGGPITIVAGCELTVSDDGVVSSRGLDPGADLVHLEGCVVTIFGLVESTGRGHSTDVNKPANSCSDVATLLPRRNPVTRPGKPPESRGCVEVWAGSTILVDATGTHKGQIRADTGVGGTLGLGWIELLANGNITILDGPGNDGAPNNSVLEGFAVHANGLTSTNDEGGLVDVISKFGSVVTSGKAIQASHVGTGGGGGGGTINVLAGQDVSFGTANIEARGKDFGGGAQNGGTIFGRAFNGAVTGTAPGELDAFGGPPLGSVTLQGCGTGALGDGVNYTGTVIPAPAIILADDCGDTPEFPVYATPFPAADCRDVCIGRNPLKRGTKFLDVNGNGVRNLPEDVGLPGWTIKVFQGGLQAFSTVTDANGNYQFSLIAGITYVVCEVLQPGWVQTSPLAGPGIVACNFEPGLAPLGYEITLQVDEIDEGNDFGNQPLEENCPEDPRSIPTRIVNPLNPGAYATVCAAYADAQDGEIIGVFGNTVENCVLGGAKTLKITQCTLAEATAESSSSPVYDITSTGVLTIIGLDTVGGTVGWKVQSNGHDIRGVRASGASEYGIQIIGNNNAVSFNSVEDNAVGVRIEGDGNDVRGGTVQSNGGDGVVIAAGASNNTFRTATVKLNGGHGIVINGSGNTVRDNKAALDNNTGNGGDGILVVGTGNTLQNNETNDNGGHGIHVGPAATGTILKANKSNRGAANGTKENTGFEYKLEVAASAPTQNTADNVSIPQTKCGFFPGIGDCE